MNKILRKTFPACQIPESMGKAIKCPRCSYEYHRIIGIYHQEGIDPHNLELECGRCEMPFYVFTGGGDAENTRLDI